VDRIDIVRRRVIVFFVPMIGALVASWSACASFSSDEPAPAMTTEAGEATADAQGSDANAAALERVTVPAPTELVVDSGRVYVATESAGIHVWTPGTSATTAFVSGASGAHLLHVGYGSMYYADPLNVLYAAPLAGADAGVAMLCKQNARAIALLENYVVYADVATMALTAASCVSRSPVTTARVDLLASNGDVLFRYEPEVAGGRIASCTALTTCGAAGVSTEVAANLGSLTLMTADADRIYWATSSAVFSVLKSGGSPTALASAQHLPKALSVSGGFVFWTNYDDGTVMRTPTDGSAPPSVVAQGLNHPWGVVATPTDVFVSESGANRVLRFARP
jgi:hypothetical protein